MKGRPEPAARTAWTARTDNGAPMTGLCPQGEASLPTALFRRSYLGYSGGHAKVWDYFGHVEASGLFRPRLHLAPGSLSDGSAPWAPAPAAAFTEWRPAEAGLLFIAGEDWEAVPEDLPSGIPILNLVQGLRHAESGSRLRGHLRRKAIRICVSRPVADAVVATGEVLGPVFVIPNGVGVPGHDPGEPRTETVLVGGQKDPAAASALAAELGRRGYQVDLLLVALPRPEYLRRIAGARVAVLLPLPAEGFYLPGLEAMALGTPVVMPDSIGCREYAEPGRNCLLPEVPQIAAAVGRLDDAGEAARLSRAGLETAARFTLSRERDRFLSLLRRAGAIWEGDLADGGGTAVPEEEVLR